MIFGKYVDPNSYPKAKKEMKKIGLSGANVTPVNMDYGFVPTRTTQSAKQGKKNVKEAHDMNMKRFGLDD